MIYESKFLNLNNIPKFGPREKFVFPPNKDGISQYEYANLYFKYIGEWKNSKKNGKGYFKIGSNSFYEGDFLNGEITGQGIRIYQNGSKYEGEFLNGEFNGKGKFIDNIKNEIYIGEWKDNKRNGQGELIFSNNTKYNGSFLNHQRNGIGNYINEKGDFYEGEWVNNQITGKGKLIYSNGDIYEGEFLNGKKNGNGKMIWAYNKLTLITQWKDDKSNYLPSSLSLSDLPPFTPGSILSNIFIRINGGEGESGRILKVYIEIGSNEQSTGIKKSIKSKKNEIIEKEPKYLPLNLETNEIYLNLICENGIAFLPQINLNSDLEQNIYTLNVDDESEIDPLPSISLDFNFVPTSMISTLEKNSGKGNNKPQIKKNNPQNRKNNNKK